MFHNRWPSKDPEGKSLQAHPALEALAGKPILKDGFFAILYGYMGDMEEFQNNLGMRHQAADMPCYSVGVIARTSHGMILVTKQLGEAAGLTAGRISIIQCLRPGSSHSISLLGHLARVRPGHDSTCHRQRLLCFPAKRKKTEAVSNFVELHPESPARERSRQAPFHFRHDQFDEPEGFEHDLPLSGHACSWKNSSRTPSRIAA